MAKTNTVTDVDKGAAKTVSAFLKKYGQIDVGVLGPKAHSKHRKSEVTVADIAGFHEFGTKNIPKRSFVRAWFDGAQTEIVDKLRSAAVKLVQGKLDGDGYVKLLGNWAVGQMRKRIASGISPSLAQSTVDRKGSNKPLIDTGVLRSSISFRVRK